MAHVEQLGLSPQPTGCEGCCEQNCELDIFPDGAPTSVQSELYGNTYNPVLSASQTASCCDGWTPKVLVKDDFYPNEILNPNCFSAGFTYEQFWDRYNSFCVLPYYWFDRVCKNPGAPLTRAAYREMSVWLAKHPTTGNIWIWALARLYDEFGGIPVWEAVVQGYLDTGMTSLATGDGPFTVPMSASCTTYYTGSEVRVGCWNTNLGSIKVTP